jgi:ABC-2 type transport system permease protein
MSWQRITSLLRASWYYHIHSFEALVDAFWWSLISLFVFGFLTLFIGRLTGNDDATTILVGLVLWEVLRLGQDSITLTALREIWSRNLSMIFTTPVSATEYFIAQMIQGIIKTSCIMVMMSVLAYYFYDISMLRLSWGLPLYVLNILFFSWSAGISVLGLLFKFGTRLQALVWSLIVILQPISGVFYPVEILPAPIQWFAYAFPVTYIFEAARYTYLTGVVDGKAIVIAFVLNVIYGIAAVLFFSAMFAESKRSGSFARLEG